MILELLSVEDEQNNPQKKEKIFKKRSHKKTFFEGKVGVAIYQKKKKKTTSWTKIFVWLFLFKRNSWPIKKMKFSVVELKERDVTVLRFLTSSSNSSDTFFQMIHLLNVVVSIFNISPHPTSSAWITRASLRF
jgi:hypothetical protein